MRRLILSLAVRADFPSAAGGVDARAVGTYPPSEEGQVFRGGGRNVFIRQPQTEGSIFVLRFGLERSVETINPSEGG